MFPLGLVQFAQGGAREFWLPRSDLTAVAGVTHEFAVLSGGLEQGSVLGTMDHAVAFALFLLVAGTLAAALYLAGAVRGGAGLLVLGLVVLTLAGIVASYVRSCLFALALTLAVGIPAGRLGTVEEYAAAAAFLCSERAGYITGVALPVDGALTRLV